MILSQPAKESTMKYPQVCCWTVALVLATSSLAWAGGTNRNPRLLNLAPNQWTKIHEQKTGDQVRFVRQAHGGSCFDTKRGRLILFGSNTHGKDWTNSPLIFDPVACQWTRLYSDDTRETYGVNAKGLAVAGKNGDHPWAMHTFGAVEYDPRRDEMVVCSYPGHMEPGRFTNALKDLWGKVKRHPTWTFRLETQTWVPLDCEPVHFFPYATAFDTDRNVVLGYSPGGVYELSGEPRTWKQLAKGGMFGWHNNAAYDSRHKALINFGSNQNSNDIVVYLVETKEHKKMPTPGVRPPADQHNPMAFDLQIGQTVVLVDRAPEKDDRGRAMKGQTETWLYDLGKDTWFQLATATPPFLCGMNYNMEYDPGHKVLLLVTGDYGIPTAVWALKIDLKQAVR